MSNLRLLEPRPFVKWLSILKLIEDIKIANKTWMNQTPILEIESPVNFNIDNPHYRIWK